LTDRAIQSREGEVSCVRDVGVAGSNPVTPTTDFPNCKTNVKAERGCQSKIKLFAKLISRVMQFLNLPKVIREASKLSESDLSGSG
jgi:hypothetical protein